MSFESYSLITTEGRSLVLATTSMWMMLAIMKGIVESSEEDKSFQKDIKSTGETRLNLKVFKEL